MIDEYNQRLCNMITKVAYVLRHDYAASFYASSYIFENIIIYQVL